MSDLKTPQPAVAAAAVTPDYVATDYEQEIRFAVVLYGGVSLAIYINGVAQELLSMVRGTAALRRDEALKGTEAVYRELGQILGISGPTKESAEPDDPIRSRFVVDIISGSSAGGINGVALAKALALKCKNMDNLRRTWMKDAQLDTLLNDGQSELRLYPRARGTNSLLNSERMYGKILEALSGMNPNGDARHSESKIPFADNIDLFVTATDLAGSPVPIQLTGGTIAERVHRTVFHFEYADGKKVKNHFDYEHDPMLAFAARCTSSFPVAFEPMRFDNIGTQIRRLRNLDLDAAASKFKPFFPKYPKEWDFRKRQFADGGYLDNRPFSYVTDLIQYRSATIPTKRKLLFVDPFPEVERGDAEPDRDISFLKNAVLAAMTLPRYEVIRGDVQRISDYNRRLERLNALRERDHRDQRKLDTPADKRMKKGEFSESTLLEMVTKHGYGQGYPRYHHLRVYQTTDALARLFTQLAGYDLDSAKYVFLRRLVRAWRDAHYDAYRDKPEHENKRPENAFLVDFDFDYRLRRLNHLRSRIDQILSGKDEETNHGKTGHTATGALDPELRVFLEHIRGIAEQQLERLRDEVGKLADPVDTPLRKAVAGSGGDLPDDLIKELKARLDNQFDYVMNQPTVGAQCDAAEIVYNLELGGKASNKMLIDALMEQLSSQLNKNFIVTKEEILKVLPEEPGMNEQAEIGKIRDAFYLYHWHDFLSLPFLEGSDAKEYAGVEVYRVSPADSGLKPNGIENGTEKLAGTAFGAFGGFLKEGWREHDMMWGRLDGAERIITALITAENGARERDGIDIADLRDRYIKKAQDIILREEFSLTPGNRDRIFHWLAYKLREEGVTTASVNDLLKRGDSLMTFFPTLKDVISQKDFRTFLLTHYSQPPAPEPDRVADWSGRTLNILGEMIEDMPEGKLEGVRKRLAKASRSGGVLLTNLLQVATPNSLGKQLSDQILRVVFVMAAILAGFGAIAGVDGAATVGVTALLSCVVFWMITRAFGRMLQGKRVLRFVVVMLSLIIAGLALWGAYSAWNWFSALDTGSLWGSTKAVFSRLAGR